MSTNKFLGITISGIKTLFTAIQVSTGAGDAGKIIGLGGDGKLSVTMMPTGIGAATQSMVSSEILAAGSFVNIFDVTGVPNCRLADCTNSRPAHGFVLAAVAASANATVFLSGSNTARSGLVPGSQYFLSTSGNVSLTAPSLVVNIIQEIGIAANPNTLAFDFDAPTMIA